VESPWPFSDFIKPVCLPTQANPDAMKHQSKLVTLTGCPLGWQNIAQCAFITGWGSKERGSATGGILKQTPLQLFSIG